MALPDVTLTIKKFGLGLIPPKNGKTQAKVGVCSKGVANSVTSFSNKTAVIAALGNGPLVDSICQALAVAGGPVIAVPVNPSVAGTVTSSFTLTGSGTATVTGSKGPDRVIVIKIILGGAVGVATFQYSVDGSAFSSTITTAASYAIPGTLSTAFFTAGTYVAADTYTMNLDGTITRVGSGTATLLDNSTHNPLDSYALKVVVMKAGAPGTGTFKYSLDGGTNYSGEIAIPSGGKFPIPETGVVLTFAGTFVLADSYVGTAVACGYANGDVTTALTALLASPLSWAWVHIVGAMANSAGAASLASAVDSKMTEAETAKRYVYGVVECPTSEADATVIAAFAAFSSERVMVCAGDVGLVSPLTGRTDRRNCAWAVTSRLASVGLARDAACVEDGSVANVASLYRDEAALGSFDPQRFTTMRTFVNLPGYYITNARMMGAPGSDFTYAVGRRVMDRASGIAQGGYLQYLNKDVLMDSETGYIDQVDADDIDIVLTQKLRADLVPLDASSVTARVDRTTNLLSSATLPADVSIVPRGYLRAISATIQFKNPFLTAST